MNPLILEVVLLLLRHGLTAVGLERIANDPDTMTQLGGAAAVAVGVGWSAYRKFRRVNTLPQIAPIPPTPPKPPVS